MLSWGSIVYGAALSAVVAGAAVAVLARPRQAAVIAAGVLAAAAGPLGWNAILRATHASQLPLSAEEIDGTTATTLVTSAGVHPPCLAAGHLGRDGRGDPPRDPGGSAS